MTIEQKAKAYDEAVEKIKDYYKGKTKMYSDIKQTLDLLFPEFKESEDDDETIRKWIIDDIRYNMNNELLNNSEYKKKAEKAIAWLEKQGEQKDINSTLIEKKKMDNVNKIEPKFKVGDWITNGDYIWKIVEVTPLDYILQSQDGNIVDDTISYVDTDFHLWTI